MPKVEKRFLVKKVGTMQKRSQRMGAIGIGREAAGFLRAD